MICPFGLLYDMWKWRLEGRDGRYPYRLLGHT